MGSLIFTPLHSHHILFVFMMKKEIAIIPITQGVYFEDIECSNHLRYEHETYYEGTACENAKEGSEFCVCFRWLDDLGNQLHFSKVCGQCRDPTKLILQ